MMCSLRRSFVILFRMSAILMHLQQEYHSSLCIFPSISIILSFNFWWLMENVIKVFSAIITLLWRNSFSFFRLLNLASTTLSFFRNSLLSLISSVCFDIKLSYSFIAKSVSCSLVISSSIFWLEYCYLSFSSW